MAGIAELVADVAEELQVSKPRAREAVDAVIGSIVCRLENLEPITLRGFGAFKIRTTKARMGRNPQTGEPLQIGAKQKVVFKAF